MMLKQAREIVRGVYPLAKVRSFRDGGRLLHHIDDGEVLGSDVTTRPGETPCKAWIAAAERVIRATKGDAR